MGKREKSTHKKGNAKGKRVPSPTDSELYSTSASSTDDTSPVRTKRRRRKTPSSRIARTDEELLTRSLDEILQKSSEMHKELEKVLENQNVQSKELEKLCKQLELQTNGTSHASDAPRSQSNQLQPPRYRLRLVFTSGNTDRIEKGQTMDISVALVEGNNDQTVENGPLASATVELVVVNSKFNEHDNQYNWSREDFDCSIKEPRHENTAKRDVDQPVKSIVSNSRFNLVRGVRRHIDSTIFENSTNGKVRLGVMVVSPTEERVLEGLSNPFFVRGHDRPPRQKNPHNSSNKQGLDVNGGQSQLPSVGNSNMFSMEPSTSQEQQALIPRYKDPHLARGAQATSNQYGLDVNGGQSQLPSVGNSNMFSTEPSTSQEQQVLIPRYKDPHLARGPQATCNQYGLDVNGGQPQLTSALMQPYLDPDWLRMAEAFRRQKGLDVNGGQSQLTSALMQPYLDPDWLRMAEAFRGQKDTQFTTNPTTRALQLVWDRPNVEPSKRHWNRGVVIEPLEPDDSDEERQLKRKRCSKYQLRFVNKACEAYHTRDPIKADDGSLLKVALFDEDRKITYGPLSSASVQIVVLHGDFNDHGQYYWTSEEFSCYEVCPRPGEEASSVLGGNCILVLADGEACLGDAFFQMTSYCARTGKFKMGVKIASAQEVRIQEGVSEPFWVKDRHFAGECGCVTGIWPEDDTGDVQASLNLSYKDLLGNIRNSFVYSSLFFNDYIKPRKTLMRRWLAEGYAVSNQHNTPKDVAELNFMKHRNMLQVKCSYLTVLDLQDSEITQVPASIGNLFNLRYLGLRRTRVKSLPETIGKLSNLQTLDMKQTQIEKLPQSIVKVNKLRHLFADKFIDENQEDFKYFIGVQPPKDLSNLIELQTLQTVEASDDLAAQLDKLRKLQRLWITNVSAMHSSKLFAALSKMPLLSCLLLNASDEKQKLCLDDLNPQLEKLHKLIIRGCLASGTLKCSILRNLKYLDLSWSGLQEDPFQLLGLHVPNLICLILNKVTSADALVISEDCFPQLKTLVMKNMLNVNQLTIGDRALPNIECLYVVALPKLDKVPHGIESLSSLKMLYLLNLHKNFKAQWLRNGMDKKMSNVLELHITSRK